MKCVPPYNVVVHSRLSVARPTTALRNPSTPLNTNPQAIHWFAIMPDKLDVQGLLQESKAEYKRLGKSGLKVSVPILGAMSIGSSKWQPWVIEEEESLPLLKAAYDRGLTTWDTGMSDRLSARLP
jgi:hypothetical protein